MRGMLPAYFDCASSVLRLLRIELQRRHGFAVARHLGREDAIGDALRIEEQDGVELVAVEGHGHGLANFRVIERRLLEVEGKVGERHLRLRFVVLAQRARARLHGIEFGAGDAADVQFVVFVAGDDRAAAEFEIDFVELGDTEVVAVVADQHDRIGGLERLHLERAGAVGLLRPAAGVLVDLRLVDDEGDRVGEFREEVLGGLR